MEQGNDTGRLSPSSKQTMAFPSTVGAVCFVLASGFLLRNRTARVPCTLSKMFGQMTLSGWEELFRIYAWLGFRHGASVSISCKGYSVSGQVDG